MVHYLRFDGYTLVDMEATKEDISCVVPIEAYTIFLLQQLEKNPDVEPYVIAHDIGQLQEIRAELFERPFSNNIQWEKPDDLAARRCKQIAKKYNLQYVTD